MQYIYYLAKIRKFMKFAKIMKYSYNSLSPKKLKMPIKWRVCWIFNILFF